MKSPPEWMYFFLGVLFMAVASRCNQDGPRIIERAQEYSHTEAMRGLSLVADCGEMLRACNMELRECTSGALEARDDMVTAAQIYGACR